MRQRHHMLSRVYRFTARHPLRSLLTLIVFAIIVCVTITALRIRTERRVISEITRRHPRDIVWGDFQRFIGITWRDEPSGEARYRDHAQTLLQYVREEVLFPVISVYLRDTQVTDDDIRALSRLPYVESVSLIGMRVTRKQFELLANIDSLRHIQLYDANVSEIDVQRFRELRPDVTIER